MADTSKAEQQKQTEQKQTEQENRQPERGELVRREPSRQLAREPFTRDLFARDPFQVMREFARNPFQAMRDLMRWEPFGEMAPIVSGVRAWSPDFEVRETKDSYVFKADLPGTKKEDLDISLIGNRLQVTGRRDEEEEARDDTYYAYERSYGSFTRSFTLPDTADTEHVRSELRDGVLTLVVPKKPEAQPRRIQISSGEKH